MKNIVFLFFAVVVLTSCNKKSTADSNAGQEEVEILTHHQADYYINQLSFRFDRLVEIQRKNGVVVDSIKQTFPVRVDEKTMITLVRINDMGSVGVITASENDLYVSPTFWYNKADTSAVFYPYPVSGTYPKKFVNFYSEINTLMDLYEAQNSHQMGYAIPAQ